MTVGTDELYKEAVTSLERIQQFDASQLPRESELGNKLNFHEAVEPAKQLIDLYKRLSLIALQDFPDNVLTTVRDNANSHYKLLTTILEFDIAQANPNNARTTAINNIKTNYQPAFQALQYKILLL